MRSFIIPMTCRLCHLSGWKSKEIYILTVADFSLFLQKRDDNINTLKTIMQNNEPWKLLKHGASASTRQCENPI